MSLRSFLCRLFCGCEDAVETFSGMAERPPIPEPGPVKNPKGGRDPDIKRIVLKDEASGVKEITAPLKPPYRRIGDDGEIRYHPTPPKITPLGKTITRQEDGWLVRTSWQVSTEQEARVYGYAYLGSRSETPMPVPEEFTKIVQENISFMDFSEFGGDDEKDEKEEIEQLYNTLQQYFKVQARTWHQAWSLTPEEPKPEQDLLLGALPAVIVYAQVLIPGWAVFNPVYQDQPDSRLKDEDYFVLSCAVSVKGTRDVQDIRAEAVQIVTVAELVGAK